VLAWLKGTADDAQKLAAAGRLTLGMQHPAIDGRRLEGELVGFVGADLDCPHCPSRMLPHRIPSCCQCGSNCRHLLGNLLANANSHCRHGCPAHLLQHIKRQASESCPKKKYHLAISFLLKMC